MYRSAQRSPRDPRVLRATQGRSARNIPDSLRFPSPHEPRGVLLSTPPAAAIPAAVPQTLAVNRGFALYKLNEAFDAVERGETPKNLGDFPPSVMAEIGAYRSATPQAREGIRQKDPREDARDSSLY